jgi:hypothetical protein
MGGPSKVTQAGRDTGETVTRQTGPKEGEAKISEGNPWRTNLEAPQTRGKVGPYPCAWRSEVRRPKPEEGLVKINPGAYFWGERSPKVGDLGPPTEHVRWRRPVRRVWNVRSG